MTPQAPPSLARWLRGLDQLLQDVRFAARQMRRAPAFVFTAALTLALGIGANTAIFSVINGFLRPLPVPDPNRIVVIAAVMRGDDTGLRYRFSFPAVEDYRKETGVFSDVFAFDVRIGGLGVNGKTSQFVYQIVTGNVFTGLGLTPAAGRQFLSGEGEHANADPIVVLGHSYWQRRFGGDPNVVGSTVRLNGLAARVVGVAPAGFRGLFEGADMDGYVPIGVGVDDYRERKLLSDRSIRLLTMLGRLRPGVTIERAQAAVDVVAARLARQYPVTEKGTSARVIEERLARPVPLPALNDLLPLIRSLLFVLSTLVLLIACMNVANLLLVRATARQREMAVRAALGAGRRRLVRLLLVESLMLAGLGASLGLLVGKWISVAFVRSIDIGTDVPLRLDFHFDWPVFGYALSMALVTGLVVGVMPAWRASRAEVTDLLHDGGRGSAGPARQRVRSLLVVSQVAGSLALLVVAGLFVRSLQKAQQIDVGFDPSHLITARLDPEHIGYDLERAWTFYDELERRLTALPGVQSVSMSFSVPLGFVFGAYAIHAEGDTAALDEPRAAVGDNSVTPGYFETLRIPIVRGRAFTDRDGPKAPLVAIVNETLATQLWPNQDPIGKRIVIPTVESSVWEVVGVARDSKYLAVFEGPLPHFYLPQRQHFSHLRSLLVRSSVPLSDLRIQVQREIEALAPDMPIADLRPFREALDGNIGFVMFRIGAWQASAMGVLGLILAVVGVYGVVSYRAAQRTREIGIRVALGAVPGDIRRLVLHQGAALVAVGIVVGLALTLALTEALTKVLLFVSTTDVATFAIVTVLLGSTAIVACYIPARRAMRVNPMTALRHE